MTVTPRFVFLLSHGRSGSSLVQELLARHPDVGFVSNVEDRFPHLPARVGRHNNAMFRRVPQRLTQKGRLRYAPSEGYRLLGQRVSPVLVASCRDLLASDADPWLATRFRRLFADRARAQGKPVFVHKFTGWPRSGFIGAALPDVRFVHIVRDPRDAVASELKTSWWNGWLGPTGLNFGVLSAAYAELWDKSGRSFPVLAGLHWKMVMDAVEAARARVPGNRWLDVRFEDLLADPQTQFKKVTEFAALPDDPRFRAALSATTFEPGRVEAYKQDLDPSSVAAMESCLARELSCWGYR